MDTLGHFEVLLSDWEGAGCEEKFRNVGGIIPDKGKSVKVLSF